ncbi:MAG: hypothetical protein MR454_09200, partial [Solobacterium sp.]|nr:hypothetical protein [Solobacterium sp.]
IDRILPEDFLIQEGSHVEEKDLNSLVRNFNSLLKEENLKPVIIEGMKRADIKANQASALMSNLLPIIHVKIKILMGNKSEPVKKEEETAVEEKVQKKLFSFKKNEDEGDKPQKKLFSFGKKEEPEENNELKTVENHDEEASNPMLDKILMAVIGVCFVAIIGVLIFILVKVNMG